jgi:nucleolar protein 56
MGKIDYLLHENATGYALFKVVHQPDRISGADSQNLATFGKMVQLVSFAPWRLVE